MASAISNRFADFENGNLSSIYVVLKNKYAKIEKSIFDLYPGQNNDMRKNKIVETLKKALD